LVGCKNDMLGECSPKNFYKIKSKVFLFYRLDSTQSLLRRVHTKISQNEKN